MTTEVAIRDDAPPVGLSLIEGPNPAGAVAYARQVSAAIAGVLEEGSGFVTISGRKHITIEGWQTMAAMTGHTVEVEWSRPVDGLDTAEDGRHSWEARAVARDQAGRVVSAGEAMAGHDEATRKGPAPWTHAEFSIRSMAQTRAQSRALASRMRYIVTLAGFAGTPADEMPPDDKPARAAATEDAPLWQERQHDAEHRAAALGVTDFVAFFASLGVDHPRKLSTASVWKKVNDELTKREADAAPVVEGVVISDEEKAERLGLNNDDPSEDPDSAQTLLPSEVIAKRPGAPGDA